MTASHDWDRAEPLTDRDAAVADVVARVVRPAAEALLDRWRRNALEPGDVEMLIGILQGPSTTRADEHDPRT